MLRFWDKVQPTADGCWWWVAGCSSNGYGAFWINGTTRSAHVMSYELSVGSVPDGLQLDHLCRNRACVNPAHLEAVTPSENSRRSNSVSGKNSRKTHCPQGHPYTGKNLYIGTGGRRVCRACQRVHQHAYYERKAKP